MDWKLHFMVGSHVGNGTHTYLSLLQKWQIISKGFTGPLGLFLSGIVFSVLEGDDWSLSIVPLIWILYTVMNLCCQNCQTFEFWNFWFPFLRLLFNICFLGTTSWFHFDDSCHIVLPFFLLVSSMQNSGSVKSVFLKRFRLYIWNNCCM